MLDFLEKICDKVRNFGEKLGSPVSYETTFSATKKRTEFFLKEKFWS